MVSIHPVGAAIMNAEAIFEAAKAGDAQGVVTLILGSSVGKRSAMKSRGDYAKSRKEVVAMAKTSPQAAARKANSETRAAKKKVSDSTITDCP